uniref:Ubiquinone biosynthesis monooxygenase COQ6, mitochondrial n=2 Tax=Diabrotica virgifera virgifera TaxID=50390 RepID=A0A6P7G0U5_DIAVI
MHSVKHVCKPYLGNNLLNILRHLSSTECSKKYYDIVIAGGGMIGTTLACALGKNSRFSGRKILLLESTKDIPFVSSEKYSNRVVSLTPGTKNLLNNIGTWKHIEEARFATVKRLQVMDALSDASITFGEIKSSDDVSYIVENNLILHSAKKEIKNTNVEILYESKVKNYELPGVDDSQVNIFLENGNQYTCDLLIGCDGVNSKVRQTMGVHYLNWNYNSTGVVATLKFCEEFDNSIAWQRWLPTGPLALLPLNSSQSSIVWSTTPEDAKRLLKLTNEQFVDAVNESFWKVFKRSSTIDQAVRSFDTLLRAVNCPADVHRTYPPKVSSIEEGSRAAFPLGFGHATSYIGKGVVLVGDAAHRVHPLAGQGVNLGFGDVSCLNKVLGDAVYSGSSLGNVSYLKEYETKRQRENLTTMVALEGMYRLYHTEFTPIVLLRSLGVQAVDVLSPLKKMIVKHASS